MNCADRVKGGPFLKALKSLWCWLYRGSCGNSACDVVGSLAELQRYRQPSEFIDNMIIASFADQHQTRFLRPLGSDTQIDLVHHLLRRPLAEEVAVKE